MSRTTETTDFVIPPAFIRQAAKIAKEERRTPRELLTEMLDVYKQHRKPRETYDERWALRLIQETQEEERRAPTPPEALRKEYDDLRRYGIAQTKKLGLRAKGVDRLLKEPLSSRKRESRS